MGSNGSTFGQSPACHNVDSYIQNFTVQNNLMAFASFQGWVCNGDGNTEGSKSEANMADPPTVVETITCFRGAMRQTTPTIQGRSTLR